MCGPVRLDVDIILLLVGVTGEGTGEGIAIIMLGRCESEAG